MLDWLNLILNWIVAPLALALLWLVRRLRRLADDSDKVRADIANEVAMLRTDLRVLEARHEAQAQYSKASHTALHEQLSGVLAKLESIETFLRGSGGRL